MLVPEAAMHQHHLSLRWKNEIGRSGQTSPMKPVAVSKTMRKTAYKKLWLRVHLTDKPHLP
jgi:hypothetical protein